MGNRLGKGKKANGEGSNAKGDVQEGVVTAEEFEEAWRESGGGAEEIERQQLQKLGDILNHKTGDVGWDASVVPELFPAKVRVSKAEVRVKLKSSFGLVVTSAAEEKVYRVGTRKVDFATGFLRQMVNRGELNVNGTVTEGKLPLLHAFISAGASASSNVKELLQLGADPMCVGDQECHLYKGGSYSTGKSALSFNTLELLFYSSTNPDVMMAVLKHCGEEARQSLLVRTHRWTGYGIERPKRMFSGLAVNNLVSATRFTPTAGVSLLAALLQFPRNNFPAVTKLLDWFPVNLPCPTSLQRTSPLRALLLRETDNVGETLQVFKTLLKRGANWAECEVSVDRLTVLSIRALGKGTNEDENKVIDTVPTFQEQIRHVKECQCVREQRPLIVVARAFSVAQQIWEALYQPAKTLRYSVFTDASSIDGYTLVHRFCDDGNLEGVHWILHLYKEYNAADKLPVGEWLSGLIAKLPLGARRFLPDLNPMAMVVVGRSTKERRNYPTAREMFARDCEIDYPPQRFAEEPMRQLRSGEELAVARTEESLAVLRLLHDNGCAAGNAASIADGRSDDDALLTLLQYCTAPIPPEPLKLQQHLLGKNMPRSAEFVATVLPAERLSSAVEADQSARKGKVLGKANDPQCTVGYFKTLTGRTITLGVNPTEPVSVVLEDLRYLMDQHHPNVTLSIICLGKDIARNPSLPFGDAVSVHRLHRTTMHVILRPSSSSSPPSG